MNINTAIPVPIHRKKKNRAERRAEEDGYYSDFNFFDNTNDDLRDSDDEYDDPFSLSVLPNEMGTERRPLSPPEGKVTELIKEEARERQVLFLEFLPCI